MTSFSNFSLKSFNTFGLDVRCRRFKEYTSVDELSTMVEDGETRVPYLHVGRGSNLLFTKDFDGLILHSAITTIQSAPDGPNVVRVRAGAGIVWDDFVAHCIQQGWYGLENLSLVPGEVGAAAVQNIGAYGAEAGDFIENVETVNLHSGSRRIFTQEECQYAYRQSVFKTSQRGEYAVTHVTFRLSTAFQPNLRYAALSTAISDALGSRTPSAEDVRDVIIRLRQSKLPDPATLGNAGSFFMNPVVSNDKANELLAQHADMPHYPAPNGVKIPAAWLIEQCGWKGRSLGPAGVYDKQALVLVNHGGATGADIVRLSNQIQDDVYTRFGIHIVPEVNFI